MEVECLRVFTTTVTAIWVLEGPAEPRLPVSLRRTRVGSRLARRDGRAGPPTGCYPDGGGSRPRRGIALAEQTELAEQCKTQPRATVSGRVRAGAGTGCASELGLYRDPEGDSARDSPSSDRTLCDSS